MRRRDLLALIAGNVIAWPICGRAQQPMPVIGYLGQSSPVGDAAFRLPGFRRGLNKAGYVEAKNVAVEYRWAESQYRFAVTHPRWEPYAGKPHVRICAGGAR